MTNKDSNKNITEVLSGLVKHNTIKPMLTQRKNTILPVQISKAPIKRQST